MWAICQLVPRVPQARVYKAWNVAVRNHEDSDYLNLASDILASGKNSRLYKRLVYEEQIATDVAAFVWLREIGGLFVMWATAQPGQDLAFASAPATDQHFLLRRNAVNHLPDLLNTGKLADCRLGNRQRVGFRVDNHFRFRE